MASSLPKQSTNDDQRCNVVFVIGRPGSGKGTQCSRIANVGLEKRVTVEVSEELWEDGCAVFLPQRVLRLWPKSLAVVERFVGLQKFGLVHFSVGDLLRKERGKSEEFDRLFEECKNSGTDLPLPITMDILSKAMFTSSRSDTVSGLLIDGFPPDTESLKTWEVNMNSLTDLKFILKLNCPEEVCIQRCLLRRQKDRSDDIVEILRKRIHKYNTNTETLLQYCQTLGTRVIQVDASRAMAQVYNDMQDIFEKFCITQN